MAHLTALPLLPQHTQSHIDPSSVSQHQNSAAQSPPPSHRVRRNARAGRMTSPRGSGRPLARPPPPPPLWKWTNSPPAKPSNHRAQTQTSAARDTLSTGGGGTLRGPPRDLGHIWRPGRSRSGGRGRHRSDPVLAITETFF